MIQLKELLFLQRWDTAHIEKSYQLLVVSCWSAMTNETILEPLEEDQQFVDSPELRSFVATVQEISSQPVNNRAETLAALEPYFTQLLNQQRWLPEQFVEPNPESAMGGGIIGVGFGMTCYFFLFTQQLGEAFSCSETNSTYSGCC